MDAYFQIKKVLGKSASNFSIANYAVFKVSQIGLAAAKKDSENDENWHCQNEYECEW